jgi:hypothetical protein
MGNKFKHYRDCRFLGKNIVKLVTEPVEVLILRTRNSLRQAQAPVLHLPHKILLLSAIVLVALAPVLADKTLRFDWESTVDGLHAKDAGSEPVGELIVKVAEHFLNVPYGGGTLEGTPEEPCRYDFDFVDCVTFYENSYAIAAAFKRYYPMKPDLDDFCKALSLIRYKKSAYDDTTTYADTLLYSDRLHYSSEWIYYNRERGLFDDITKDLGGIAFKPEVSFMSSHRDKYPNPLAKDDAILEKIKENESFINAQSFYYIPENKIAGIEDKLQNGDLIFITGSIKGLDYNHTGIITVTDDGERHFMHASSSKDYRKVIIDKTISEYVKSIKRHTGITVLRPLDIR